MPVTPSHLVSAADERETQYRELWPVVRAMLRGRYAGLDDHEELYQEAWTELLEYEAGGREVQDVRALLKTIADRRARDRIRNYRPTVVDPESATFTQTADVAPLPDEQTQVRLDAATIRHVIDTLDEREAAALKLRYDLLLDAKEISRRLGITPKRLEKVMTSAYRQIAEALAADGDGHSAWSRRQRSLLLACETGFASARQRRQAEHMLATDPHCRAMLAQLRVALRDVAAVLPFPAAVEEERTRRVLELFVDCVDRVLPGGRRAARQVAEGLAPSGAAEPITYGATAIGAGGVAKVALACLAAGGGAAACLTIAAPDGRPPVAKKAAPPRARAAEPPERPMVVLRRVSTPPRETKTRRSSSKPRRRAPERERAVSSSTSRPAASPAPAGSTEFDPGVLGSTQAPTQPAAAPSNGGGEFTP